MLAVELVDRAGRARQHGLVQAAATMTIPIVLLLGADPVKFGLFDSLARPGGNMTGILSLNQAVVGKQLDVLRELEADSA